MTEEKKEQQDPTGAEELDDEAELLPNREVMSTINLGEDPAIWGLPVEPRDGV